MLLRPTVSSSGPHATRSSSIRTACGSTCEVSDHRLVEQRGGLDAWPTCLSGRSTSSARYPLAGQHSGLDPHVQCRLAANPGCETAEAGPVAGRGIM
jgi:hypothetical protein